jgi:hypothetical protein
MHRLDGLLCRSNGLLVMWVHLRCNCLARKQSMNERIDGTKVSADRTIGRSEGMTRRTNRVGAARFEVGKPRRGEANWQIC